MKVLSFTKSKEEKFWNWFQENDEMLYTFEKDRESVFDQLASQLHKVDKDLTFEFGPVLSDGKREFIISAGGIQRAFPCVENLFRKAPRLERWIVIKFRQRKNSLHDLSYANKTVKADDVFYMSFKDDDPDKIGLMLFFKDYKEAEEDIWGQIGFLFLDEVLGEYDIETKVGAIVFESTESEHFENAYPIKELPNNFDVYFGRR